MRVFLPLYNMDTPQQKMSIWRTFSMFESLIISLSPDPVHITDYGRFTLWPQPSTGTERILSGIIFRTGNVGGMLAPGTIVYPGLTCPELTLAQIN